MLNTDREIFKANLSNSFISWTTELLKLHLISNYLYKLLHLLVKFVLCSIRWSIAFVRLTILFCHVCSNHVQYSLNVCCNPASSSKWQRKVLTLSVTECLAPSANTMSFLMPTKHLRPLIFRSIWDTSWSVKQPICLTTTTISSPLVMLDRWNEELNALRSPISSNTSFLLLVV